MTIFRKVALFVVTLAWMAAPGWAEEPRPLSDRGNENLVAFSRLLSLLRFFHPSDAAAAVDWNRVAVAGVGAVEEAADAQSLARSLEDFFRPLAPTLRVYPDGQRAETPRELKAPGGTGPFKTVAWRHFGGKFKSPSKTMKSERIDDRTPPGFGTLFQALPASSLKGRRVRLRAAIRTEMEPGGFAQMGLRVDRAGGQRGFFDNMADRPIRETAWGTYEITGDVAPDAERIVVILVLTGGGKVWLDEVSLEPVDGPSKGKAGEGLANASFEEGETGKQPPGWVFPYESIQTGYHLLLRRGEACREGRGCVEMASDEIAAPRIPKPEEALEIELGGGVTASVPLSLWADAVGTLPHPLAGSPLPPWAAVDSDADTRTARLAAVAVAWGIQQQLHPELDRSRPEWQAALPAALAEAARAADREAFRSTLKRLLVPLDDVRSEQIFHREDKEPVSLPLAWAWVEDRLVVVQAAPEAKGLQAGDAVTTIDGQPVAEALRGAEELVTAPQSATRRWLAVGALAQGSPGSKVALEIERSGKGPFTVTLERKMAVGSVLDTPLSALAEPRPGIFYVDLRRTTDQDLPGLLPKLAKARGIVFDLRGETEVSTVLLSHLATATAQSSSWQLPVVMRPDFQGVSWLTTFWTIEPKEPHLRAKVAFVTDGRALGYSETLLGMVERYRWAEFVGEPSAGANGNFNWTPLPGGYQMGWTASRVLKHDGSPWHGVGVKPTVPASRTLQGIAAGRDEMIERAVEVVAGNRLPPSL